MEFLISDKLPLKKAGDQDYELGDAIQLHAENAALESRDGKTYLKLAPGKPFTLTYRWK